MRGLILLGLCTAALASPALAEDANYITGIGTVHLFSEPQTPANAPPPPAVSDTPNTPARAVSNFNGSHVVLNNIYDPSESGKLQPFVGFGVGGLNLNSGFQDQSNSTYTPAYQATAGVAVDLGKQLLGKFTYNMLGADTSKVLIAGTPAKVEYKRRSLILGLDYRY